MKKIVLLAIFIVAIVCQEASKATPIFWKIEAEKPVYLLGTIHLGVDAAKEFPAEVWENLQKCKTLVLEIDMSNVNQFAMMTKMQLPPGKTLDQLLGADYWSKFQEFVKPQPAALFKGFKPWVVQSIAAQKFMPLTPAVEMTLMEKANKSGIKIEALETMDDQLEAIDSVPEEEHVKSIKRMLDDTEGARKETLDLLNAYRSGDLGKIKKMALESEEAKEAPGMIEHVMVNRNKKWIPAIEKYIAKGNVFIAVGAAHFVGDNGVIKLLEAKGYKITRIEYTQE
ncbi:TraB/GumN family protein [Candidatus Uabimicrobium amorphum]|uniref:Conjugative transfer protein GumN n=1 Tax=Uabimicrobium amorphum TaxID=2596890 RepID=A0A5S9ITP4_UABAM|nr:TraB/GumN family protein [Candidatus Uabimicrobium amorphum]BBM87744.1 conjugative transfer protein GumN [Candidatus Uabimicrobium amorphum]